MFKIIFYINRFLARSRRIPPRVPGAWTLSRGPEVCSRLWCLVTGDSVWQTTTWKYPCPGFREPPSGPWTTWSTEGSRLIWNWRIMWCQSMCLNQRIQTKLWPWYYRRGILTHCRQEGRGRRQTRHSGWGLWTRVTSEFTAAVSPLLLAFWESG